MGSLLAYSALATKVKAMKSHLISENQYRELAAADSVTNSVEYLKRQPSYADILSSTEAGELHRGALEELLLQSKYADFSKLYRFSNLSQRKFLDLYFMHYEIAILKRCIRSIMGHRSLDLNLDQFQDFFEKHSRLDLIRLTASKSLEEFTGSLAGSPYSEVLAHLTSQDNLTMFDYEMNLDLIYLKNMWKVTRKSTKGSERDSLQRCFGSRLDLLNIQWIYRCIKFYHMSPDDICALLIPISYRLKPDQVRKLAECSTLDEFWNCLANTHYGNLSFLEIGEQPNPEALSEAILNQAHQITAQKDPYSIASINSYLYFKELEINRIINIIESIRYGLNSQEILSSVMHLS